MKLDFVQVTIWRRLPTVNPRRRCSDTLWIAETTEHKRAR